MSATGVTATRQDLGDVRAIEHGTPRALKPRVHLKLAAAASLIFVFGVARAQTYDQLVDLYRYDHAAPLNVHMDAMPTRGGFRLYSVRYAMPKTGHVSGFLVVPDGTGRRPAIVWTHSGGPRQYLGDAVLLAKAGAVSIVVGEAEDLPGGTSELARDQLIADVVALRRAVDVLENRDDVDGTRIALVGHSSGAMMGAVAASIDKRFRAAVFEVGELGMSVHIGTSPGDWATRTRKELGKDLPHFLRAISAVDAGNYIGHAPAIPKLFQSAWYDPGVPHKDAQDFFDAATGPKELKWYDTGHDIDDIAAMADRARFLAKALGLEGIEGLLQKSIGQR